MRVVEAGTGACVEGWGVEVDGGGEAVTEVSLGGGLAFCFGAGVVEGGGVGLAGVGAGEAETCDWAGETWADD